jgi:hypothetical protein
MFKDQVGAMIQETLATKFFIVKKIHINEVLDPQGFGL